MDYTQNGLAVIANKAPVVATHIGVFGDGDAERTFTRYAREASTYIRPPEIEAYQNKLLETVKENRTAIGCLVAPFGYGKTSTAIDIWKACEGQNVLAVPPFSCGSVAEMGRAIASGVTYLLRNHPRAVARIESAYEAYLVSSSRRLAEQDAQQYDIDFETALKSIEDKIKHGILHLEASGTHLLAFIEQLTQIAVDSGYNGLLVVVDEFQQFLGNINKAVITNFRTLVWGLRTRGTVPFGLLITMDPDTERNLTERAGDILHRIKEDGLYLDFSSVYDREFPRLLWARYAETYGFASGSHRIIDRATLDAIGQICERADLSNGPRTVIDLFQRVAAVYAIRQHPYSPIDLIDDFMAGEIRFDGDRSKIASLVTELSSYDYIKRVPERFQTLKLIAAFPRGCPRELAVRYGLEVAYDQLADELRGEVLTALPEGTALIDLQRVGKPQNKLNIILKKYWMQITEEEIIADRAVKLFADYAVTPLFPPFRNALAGWSATGNSFQLTSSGSYQQIYEGTFFEEYPMRRVCVEVCRSIEHREPPPSYVDAHLIFVMHNDRVNCPPPAYDRESRTLILYVPINGPFRRPLPRDVRWIEEYLRPVIMTPGVMLSLLSYIDQQVPSIEGMTENEHQRIADHQRKLQDFLLAMVFGEELFGGLDMHVISRGEQALRDVLFSVFHAAYPAYQTLITSPQWESQLKNYIDALRSVNPVIGRGIEPLRETKAAIAARFGMRNYAGFESQARQYSLLLTLDTWSGDRGTVQFKRHPSEDILVRAISLHEGLAEGELYDEVRAQGLLSVEVDYLLTFLTLRGYIEHDVENGRYVPARTFSRDELVTLSHEIVDEIDLLSAVADGDDMAVQRSGVLEIITQLADNENDLMEAQVRLLQIDRDVRLHRPQVTQQIYAQLTGLREHLHELIIALEKELPQSHSNLGLDTHINGAKRALTRDRTAMGQRLSNLVAEIGKNLEQPVNGDDLHAITHLAAERVRIGEMATQAFAASEALILLSDTHMAWIKLADQIKRQYGYLPIAASLINTDLLREELDTAQREIGERLSTAGLREYQQIYANYAPRVEKVALEIQTALNASQIAARQTKVLAEKGEKRQRKQKTSSQTPEELLLALVGDNGVSFCDLVVRSAMPPEQLVVLLTDLEKMGMLTIHVNRGKRRK